MPVLRYGRWSDAVPVRLLLDISHLLPSPPRDLLLRTSVNPSIHSCEEAPKSQLVSPLVYGSLVVFTPGPPNASARGLLASFVCVCLSLHHKRAEREGGGEA